VDCLGAIGGAPVGKLRLAVSAIRGRRAFLGLSSSASEISTTSADGTDVVAVTEGQGRPIVIVHPGSDTGESWQRVARQLTPRFRVLRLRRRVYREGARVRSPHSIAREVDDVVAITELLGEPALLVGHSSGAIVALEAALRSPASFAGLLLYEPPVATDAPLGGDALLRARAALDAGHPGEAMAIHMREIVRMPRALQLLIRLTPPLWSRMRTFAPGQIADDEAIEALGIGLDRYAHLDVPALLLGGDRSPAHLANRLEALALVLPRLDSVRILHGQGHLANVRAPNEVAAVIQTFADKVFN
jgi:pimeloyl-ACP methyl ester carboxylesterase